MSIVKVNEILKEQVLLARINQLPTDLQRLVGDFSQVVVDEKKKIKYEFFDRWIIQNTERIMTLLNGWTKPQVGFVLNSIIRLESPDFNEYLKGGDCYKHWSTEYMRKQIKVHISHRTKIMRKDILEDLKQQRTYVLHEFVPCLVNPEFDECPPIRVYGAYKAIEEYDTLLKMKKSKKSKK